MKPSTLKAQITAESSWNPTAISRHPVTNEPIAYGLCQFKPSTGAMYGLKNKADLFNPEKSVHAMAKLMSQYINKHRRRGLPVEQAKREALIDYNCGPNCKGLDRKNGESTRYIARFSGFERFYKNKEAGKKQ